MLRPRRPDFNNKFAAALKSRVLRKNGRIPLWMIFNRKRMAGVLALALILVLAAWGGWRLMSRGEGKTVPPREAVKAGLEKTFASRSFRYQAETRLTAGDKDKAEFFSSVEGERVAPDKVRMKGTMLNMPIEFVQIGNTSYFRDQPAGKWVTLRGNKLADSELFYAELNPLAFFNFKDIQDLKYKGEEKVNGEKLLLYEMRPSLTDPFLEQHLTGYSYQVWLSPSDYRLRQAVLQARDKQDPAGGIVINLRLWDYDGEITIAPPEGS